MSDYLFSTRVNGEHIAFDVAADALIFDDAAITASAVRVVVSGGSIAFSVAGKTVWLDGLKLEDLALPNLQFANGSMLLVGDGTADTFHDAYGYHIDLGASKVGNQVWGLGGADLVVTGRGATGWSATRGWRRSTMCLATARRVRRFPARMPRSVRTAATRPSTATGRNSAPAATV